jgi:ATP-binding protein involved in chromosome partitioning
MSYFQCPQCGGRTDLFGHGGARQEAGRLGVPFLGAVPLRLDVRLAGDAGRPSVVEAPEGPAGLVFRAIAEQVLEAI